MRLDPCYEAAMETKPPIPLAILVGIQTPEVDDVAHAASLEELGRLVKTLGYEVVGTLSQRREGTGAGLVLGSGKLAELAALTGGTGVVGSMATAPKSKARERFEGGAAPAASAAAGEEPAQKPEFVIVDHELSPSQIRNLERATGAQVLDRTGVIVEIFHRHANTREAKLQVEMARLKYVAPRLRESGGGGERRQGPGAGESSLDLDRRKIRDRLAELKDQLEAVQRDGEPRRAARDRRRCGALAPGAQQDGPGGCRRPCGAAGKAPRCHPAFRPCARRCQRVARDHHRLLRSGDGGGCAGAALREAGVDLPRFCGHGYAAGAAEWNAAAFCSGVM